MRVWMSDAEGSNNKGVTKNMKELEWIYCMYLNIDVSNSKMYSL